MERHRERGRGGELEGDAEEAPVRSSVASSLKSPIKIERVEPYVTDHASGAPEGATLHALGEEVKELKDTVREMQRVMLSEMKAMKEPKKIASPTCSNIC